MDQRPRDGHFLLHPLRELRRQCLSTIAEPEAIQRARDRTLRMLHPIQPRVDEQVEPNGQSIPEPGRFGEETDARRGLRRGARGVNGIPAMLARPPDGTIRPPSILSVVVLPAPFGPSRPKISPGSTRSDTPSTAIRSSKRRERSFASIMRVTCEVRQRERPGTGRETEWSRSPSMPPCAACRELGCE